MAGATTPQSGDHPSSAWPRFYIRPRSRHLSSTSIRIITATTDILAATRGYLPVQCRRPDLTNALLEPVMGVGLIVEGGDLAVAGRSVQADRLAQRPINLQSQRHDTVLR